MLWSTTLVPYTLPCCFPLHTYCKAHHFSRSVYLEFYYAYITIILLQTMKLPHHSKILSFWLKVMAWFPIPVFFVQATQKSMLSTWSKLYKVFARCSALVVTAEENICCEELCAKMAAAINREALMVSRWEENCHDEKARKDLNKDVFPTTGKIWSTLPTWNNSTLINEIIAASRNKLIVWQVSSCVLFF